MPAPDLPDEPLGGLLRKASPGGDLLARAALAELQARLFGRSAAPVRVGRYALEERIGAGGGGVVYRAYDPKHERKVALKLLHAREGSDREAARARLLREAQALAKLSHPNVVRILDVGTYEPAAPEPARGEDAGAPGVYLVMELLEGGELGRWLAEAPRGWQEVRDALLAAGRGLAAAHAQGIVHRDFKPANVWIDVEGCVRVLDFGLARPLAVPASDPSLRMTAGARQRLDALARPLAATLTAPGTLLGTPTYMAPEQHERQRATARSDQYGFCVTLYEAWYGRRPFLATTEDELRALKRRGEVLPPPAGSEVPPHLWAVLRRGLSPRPEDRFESMEALLAALVVPAPRWWQRRRRVAGEAGANGAGASEVPRSRRGRALAVVGAVGMLGIGAGAWVLARGDEGTPAVVACAEQQHERTRALLAAARGADEAGRRRVAEVRLRWPEASRCDAASDPGTAAIDAALADALRLAAEGRADEARAQARQAHARAKEHGDLVRQREAAAWHGHLALEAGALAEAEAALTEALWSDAAAGSEVSLLATIDLLALAARSTPRPPDAVLWIRLARERAALPSVPAVLRLRLHLGLGRLALADDDRTRARVDLRQALAVPLDDASAPWRLEAERALAEAEAAASPPAARPSPTRPR